MTQDPADLTRDSTERKDTADSLRLSDDQFRLILESVSDYAIFLLDAEGHVMTWNNGARRIKQYEESEIIGAHFSRFYPPDAIAIGLPETLLRNALREGRAEDEGWRIRKDGTTFWGNVVITALYNDQRELRGFAKITRDLTDRRHTEQLREAGRRKDAFLATLAHELRNPLAPMLPGIDILLHSRDSPETVVKVSGMLRRQVEQMSALIDDLLDMSRITTGKIVLRRARLPLKDAVEVALEAVAPAAEALSHHLEVHLPAGETVIETDPHRFAQILSNLLSNAIKYTPAGGEIVLTITLEAGSLVKISVRDNGMGIPKSLQSAIFELFDQGANGSTDGLGIGLTLVRNLAQMQGGSVTVHSDGTGHGSEFVVILPILADRLEQEPPPETSPATPSGKLRVLVADDNQSAADVLSLFFQLEGMETAVAYNGEQAVDAARSFSPDIACLDLGMPLLDGFEAARRIRQLHPGTFLIALSGWGGDEDRRRSAEAGFDLHQMKPINPEQLRAILSGFRKSGEA